MRQCAESVAVVAVDVAFSVVVVVTVIIAISLTFIIVQNVMSIKSHRNANFSHGYRLVTVS